MDDIRLSCNLSDFLLQGKDPLNHFSLKFSKNTVQRTIKTIDHSLFKSGLLSHLPPPPKKKQQFFQQKANVQFSFENLSLVCSNDRCSQLLSVQLSDQ